MSLSRVPTVLFLFLSLGVFSSCTRDRAEEPPHAALLYPKKEDLYLRAGQTLTLAEYYSLQESFPSLTPVNLLKLAAFTQIARREGLKKNPTLSIQEVAGLIREILPPPLAQVDDAALEKRIRTLFNMESRKEFLSWLEKSLTSENTQWNLPLLHEIHVEKTPWG